MRGKMVLGLVIILVLVVSSFPCYAQSSNFEQRIVGTWTGNNPNGYSYTLVFNANGSGTCTVANEGQQIGETNFTYGISLGGSISYVPSVFRTSYGNFDIPGGTVYFSPDGRVLILGNTVLRKR